MRTWNQWYADLDSLVDPKTGGQLPDIRDFLDESQRCRTEMGFARNDLRLRILDELWTAALHLVYLDKQAAETHRRSAALLQARWHETSGRAGHRERREPGPAAETAVPDLAVFLNRLVTETHRKRCAVAVA